MRTLTGLALLGIILGIVPAEAQSGLAAPKAGEDRSPEAGPRPHHPQYVTPTGRRKPPGEVLDEREGTTPRLRQYDRDIQEHTLKGICQGSPDCKGGHRRR